MKDIQFKKLLVFVNALVPLALLGWDALHNRLGANPLEFVTRTTGTLTLIFLILTLAITPARKLAGVQGLIRFRRMLGLYAFFYGALHLMTYVWFDKAFNVGGILQDIGRRPFIAIGMFSFFLMIPLAVTSTDKMIKRLGGKRWSKLHKATYVAAIAGVVHHFMLVKADMRKPILFASGLALLLGYRLYIAYFSGPSRKPLSITEQLPPRS